MIFCILLERGPGFQPGRSLEEQGLGPHRDYLKELAARGVVLAAGPFTNLTSGMILISVGDPAEAQRILREDPAVLDAILVGEVREWNPLIDPDGRLAVDGPRPAGGRA